MSAGSCFIGLFEPLDRALRIAPDRVERSDVVRGGAVGDALGQPLLEAPNRKLVVSGGTFLVAPSVIGGAQLLVRFDERSVAERVLGRVEEAEAQLELCDGIVQTALAVVHVPEPNVGAENLKSLAARQRPLLQLDGLVGGMLGALVPLAQRVEQRQLEIRVAAVRECERNLVGN